MADRYYYHVPVEN